MLAQRALREVREASKAALFILDQYVAFLCQLRGTIHVALLPKATMPGQINHRQTGFVGWLHTTELAGGNPFEYLVALLENPKAVAGNPIDWMPWNYAATLGQLTAPVT